MKSIIAIGFTLLIFATTSNWWVLSFTIAYLVLAFIVELYVIGDEKTRID